MGIAAGPYVPRDGLILWYDFANTKSFRGEPTTNLVPSTYAHSLYAYASGPVDTTVTNENLQSIIAKRYTITSAVNVARAAIYPSGMSLNTFYTISFKWKYNGTNTSSPEIAISAAKGNPEVNGSNSFAFERVSTTNIGNRWNYSVYTFSFSSSPTLGCILTYGIITGSDTSYIGNTFDIYEVQFEVKPYATTYVLGSRGTTVATGGGVIDLTGRGNNAELVNGPTASSDLGGLVSFDGTNDYLLLPNGILSGASDFTIIQFLKCNAGQGGTTFGNYPAGNLQLFFGTNYIGMYLGNNIAYLGSSPWSTQLPQFTTSPVMIAAVRSGTTTYFYINGILEKTGSSSSSIGTSSAEFRIGTNTVTSERFIGSIYTTSIFNRALSATEILQKYNSLRARFISRQTIVTNGLVLHLDAANRDSFSGGITWRDLSGWGNNGTLTNGPVFRSNGGGNIQFDGINDFIDIGNQSTLAFTNGIFTVESWVYTPNTWTGGSQYPNLVSKGGRSGWDTDGWALFVFRDWPSSSIYSWGLGLRNSGVVQIFGRYTMRTNTFVHIVAVVTGTSVILYENGQFYSTNTQTINPALNSTNVLIGKDSSNNMFPGSIGQVKIYNRALSAADVLQNFNATKSRFGL